MSGKQYDVAIIGGSLSARIAAALLAKQGSSVIFLRYQEATASEWFHSSLFLEKLLGTLGGRSCFVAQKPIQVISSKARVTLNNDIELDKELNREFGANGPTVTKWFEALRAQGILLENFLFENGGLPWPSLKTTASFKFLSLRRKINWGELDAPITDSLQQIPPPALDFVTDLLQGLALKRIDSLSRAQIALLWAQATRPENLIEPDFSELLAKRFDQFHGAKLDLEDLERIDFNGSRWTGGKTRAGGQFTAKTFLLGDIRWVDRFKAGKVAAIPSAPSLLRMATSSLTGQLSPLLSSRIICGGSAPLRLALEENGEQMEGLILSGEKISEEAIRTQLEPVLPFAKYTLSTINEHSSTPGEPKPTGQQKLASLPLQLGSNLFCADSNALLPEMGASGAALLGWTLAENLASTDKL